APRRRHHPVALTAMNQLPDARPESAVLVVLLPVADQPASHPQHLRVIAREAEAAGVTAVGLGEHVVIGPRTDRYRWGPFRYAPDAPWYEPLIVLSSLAAVTTEIRLATGIVIAPLRPAVLLAKMVATLDVVAGGRLDLGVGTGWQ